MDQHLSQIELSARLGVAAELVIVGAEYRHYKGNRNQVLDIAILEATGEPCVTYKALYGQNLTFIRPVSIWLEEVEWQGQTVKRFTEV